MGSKFGFHSGDVHAKNIQAGIFLVSGAAGEVTDTAFNFKGAFHNKPRVILQQELKIGVAADTVYGASVGALYQQAVNMSGASCSISGVTTAGFTAHLVLPAGIQMQESGGSASGAIFNYIAIDDVTR